LKGYNDLSSDTPLAAGQTDGEAQGQRPLRPATCGCEVVVHANNLE
jgi:hypothetical protein